MEKLGKIMILAEERCELICLLDAPPEGGLRWSRKRINSLSRMRVHTWNIWNVSKQKFQGKRRDIFIDSFLC